jgi:hypothetical protein
VHSPFFLKPLSKILGDVCLAVTIAFKDSITVGKKNYRSLIKRTQRSIYKPDETKFGCSFFSESVKGALTYHTHITVGLY